MNIVKTSFFEFITIFSEEIVIEGYVEYFNKSDHVEILLKAGKTTSDKIEYSAELFDRKEDCISDVNGISIEAKGFRFVLNKSEMPDFIEVQLCLRYQGEEMVYTDIEFGKFFPLSKQLKSSYICESGILLTYFENRIRFLKVLSPKMVRKYERKLQREILSKKDRTALRGWIARAIYHILKPLKRKEIWLISDRLTRADDNGEAFFLYMNKEGNCKNIVTFFVLDKCSEDYGRLHKLGKVVPYHSMKHKILSLLCDKIISSQAEDYVFNRFFDQQYFYKDIQHRQKFIFLQHGVTKDDLSRWLRKPDRNISLFVTATYKELQSILDYPYYYGEDQIKCTGFPRYDFLYDNSGGKRFITFMPTWRSYLVSGLDVHTDSRTLLDGFEESSYCRMYRQVFSSRRLCDAVQKYGYTIRFMPHPGMPLECLTYFKCDPGIEILKKGYRYKEIFADSKLLITDYSSTVFDFAYLRKPVLYYQQDAEEFFSGNHTYDKGYFDYDKDGFGEVEYTAEALIDRIIEYMENECCLKEIYRNRIEKTFAHHDKNNCKRVYEEIKRL